MKRSVIITAYNTDSIVGFVQSDDYVICADGGYDFAVKAEITPNIVIGDMDSIAATPTCKVIKFPKDKDDTDTMLAIKHSLEMGFKQTLILGGIGGRIDHTIANMQSLIYACKHGIDTKLIAGSTVIYPATNKLNLTHTGTLSIFSHSDTSIVTVDGCKYNGRLKLSNQFPLGTSNTALGDVTIKVNSGIILVVTN